MHRAVGGQSRVGVQKGVNCNNLSLVSLSHLERRDLHVIEVVLVVQNITNLLVVAP